MKKKFTENDILRFLYGEMSPKEHDAFLDAMYEDEALFEAFEEMKHAQASLQEVTLAPSEKSMERVMRYAKRAARDDRPRRKRLAYAGNGSLFGFNQMVSIVMVVFTVATIGIALFIYQKSSKPSNSWKMTETHQDLLNPALDARLDMAKKRLQNMLDNKSEAIVPVHHNTYRVVTSDLFVPQDQNVVFLQVK